MYNMRKSYVGILLVAGWLAAGAATAEVCQGFGPQSPRDIDQAAGENARIFSLAPGYEEMNLCNIHFHAQAEHRGENFSLDAGVGDDGQAQGYRCNAGESLTKAELKTPAENLCEGVNPGDTIEVHWVHSSCDVEPGKGLGSCLADGCSNPNLRVETQVFLVVNDSAALDFNELAYDGHTVDGYHQAKRIPNDTGTPVEYLGSTTGPTFDQETCSPLQVSWSVRPQCAKVDVNTLSAWCADNVFEEGSAQGVRELVTDPALLSAID